MANKNKKEINKEIKKNNGKNFIAKNRIIVGIVFVVLAILLGVFILPKAVQGGEYTVYTLKRNVDAGTTLSMDMLTAVSTSDQTLAKHAVTGSATKNIEEYVAKYDLEAGSYLLSNQIGKSDGQGGTDIVPEGKQIISVPVSSIYTSVSYSLSKNDIIRFYSTHEDESRNINAYIPANLCYVKVYNVYDSDGIETSVSGAAPASISLVVTETQALDIVTLINTSKVYYSLMSSGDVDAAEKFLDYQDKILEGEIQGEDKTVDLSDVNVSGSVTADIYTQGKAESGNRN